MPPPRRKGPQPVPSARRPRVAGTHRRAGVPDGHLAGHLGVDISDHAPDRGVVADDSGVPGDGVPDQGVLDQGVPDPETEVADRTGATSAPPDPAAVHPTPPDPAVVGPSELDPAGNTTEVSPPNQVAAPWLTPRRGIALLAVLAVVLVVAGGLAVWFNIEAATSSQRADTANVALVDGPATQELLGATDDALQRVFSYDYAKLDDTLTAATRLTTGMFGSDYVGTFDQVRSLATQQKIRLTATVLTSGAKILDGDNAQVVAFLDFRTERVDSGQSGDSAARMLVTMQRVDGHWKISQVTPL